jgi:hypothetical protein
MKWGTCEGCRWRMDRGYGRVCVRMPSPTNGQDPAVLPEWTCGEWEPPEGRRCGSCEHFWLQDNGRVYEGQPTCRLNRTTAGEKDTCAAWSWLGDGMEFTKADVRFILQVFRGLSQSSIQRVVLSNGGHYSIRGDGYVAQDGRYIASMSDLEAMQ